MAKQLLPHVVAQGEHLEKLAFLHGFDAREVWKDPKNDAIRALRKDPLVLRVGKSLVRITESGIELSAPGVTRAQTGAASILGRAGRAPPAFVAAHASRPKSPPRGASPRPFRRPQRTRRNAGTILAPGRLPARNAGTVLAPELLRSTPDAAHASGPKAPWMARSRGGPAPTPPRSTLLACSGRRSPVGAIRRPCSGRRSPAGAIRRPCFGLATSRLRSAPR